MSDISDLLTKNQTLCLISDRLSAENAILRADLAAVTERMSKLDFERTVAELERDSLRAENKRLREALIYYAEEDYNGYNGSGACARAALEGVTNKEGAGNE